MRLRLHEAPVSAAGIALQMVAHAHPRLTADSIRPYVGLIGVLLGVCPAYFGAVFGARRVLLLGIVLFFTTSLLGPLSPNLSAFLMMQFLGGIGSGTFIPLTISFIIRSLPLRFVIYAIALYAMNSELSQNIG